MKRILTMVVPLLLISCGGDAKDAASNDSVPRAAQAPDTIAAATLRDSATATLASLLDKPETASFDSVIVVQPPLEGERLPAMAVCGRISGQPGIEGRAAPTRFVFQSKWALYVEEAENREQFAQVWANLCARTGGMVVVR